MAQMSFVDRIANTHINNIHDTTSRLLKYVLDQIEANKNEEIILFSIPKGTFEGKSITDEQRGEVMNAVYNNGFCRKAKLCYITIRFNFSNVGRYLYLYTFNSINHNKYDFTHQRHRNDYIMNATFYALLFHDKEYKIFTSANGVPLCSEYRYYSDSWEADYIKSMELKQLKFWDSKF